MATILKWAQNTQGKLNMIKSNINSNSNNNNNSEKKWIHPPESLQKGHIAYLVKFLGNTDVDEPKGIEIVKEAIRKLRFTQQLRKSENGGKTKKVELTISIDGVAIQEPKTHMILHQFPLHQISYCADDKGEKNFFSFIVKLEIGVDWEKTEYKHECFVFISEKLAEEITLTIGQAFELAYKRFLETSGKDLEAKRTAISIRETFQRFNRELNMYRNRLMDISEFTSIRAELDEYLRKNNLKNLLDMKIQHDELDVSSEAEKNYPATTNEFLDLTDLNGSNASIKPKPSPAVGTKLEGLLLNELDHVVDDDFDPRSFEKNPSSNPPLIAPPPRPAKRNNMALMVDVNEQAASAPSGSSDPFEMGDFGASSATSQDIENAIGLLDKRILEMKTGFSRGISFGNDNFSLDNLDPLKN